ncbi:MAG: hypothetical protein WC998_10010 [Candidatus Paceibacterota bacterium]|jgi:hypothetical protein
MALQLLIQEFQNNPFAEASTTTTIKITAHGLETGDMIVNQDRRFAGSFDPCSRVVTKVDSDTLTVAAITGQVAGDTIRLYKFIDRTGYLKTETLNISDRMDRRNNCTFKLILPDNTYIPQPGQNVKIVYGGDIIFGGAIKMNKLRRIGVAGKYKLEANVDIEGYNHIPSRRTVPAEYLNKTSKEIIKDVLDNYLSQEGITYVDGDLGDGAYWDEYPEDFANNCISCSQILDDMTSASGYKWYIDHSKVLHFFAEDTITDAANVIKDSDAFVDYRSVEIEETLINYRNKQFIRGGGDDFGDTIMIYQQSLAEIEKRQDVEGGSGVYGSIFEDSNMSNTVEITAEAGTNTTNVKFTSHTLETGDMAVNTTRGNAKRIIIKVDADNFTMTGDGVTALAVLGQTTGDKIVYYPDANNAARNNLKRYGKVIPKELTFETGTLDFRAGQKLTVNLAEFGMDPIQDEYFLIEEVNFFATSAYVGDDYVIRANVKATSRDESDFSTQHTENWIDTFATFVGGGTSKGKGINIAVGPNPPNNPKKDDLWVDTDDYTEHQQTVKTTSSLLTKADAGIIEVSAGTATTQTLPTLTSADEDKLEYYINNTGSGTVTIAGTVNGVANPTIDQYESKWVRWNGTDWYSIKPV